MAEAGATPIGQALAAELDAVKLELESAAVSLCMDPAVFAGHADALQCFDRLAQVIAEVATLMRHAGPPEAALDGIRLEALRVRLNHACAA